MNTRGNRRFRILQILPECHERSHDPGDLAEEIVAAFPRTQYEVTSAYFQGTPVAGSPPSKAEHVHYFDLPDSALKGMRLSLLKSLYRYCQISDFDVVICHRYKPVSAMLLLNRSLKIPVCIGISHGFGEYKSLWRRIYARTFINERWQFVGVSSAVAQYLREQHCGFIEKNTHAISNAIDIDEAVRQQYGKIEARRLLGLPEYGSIIGAIGRLVPVKGHIYLIRAFHQISKQFPGAHLAIIGEGRSRAELEIEIANSGLGERVHLLGWQSHAKRYARAFDILTMPSLSEGFSLALMEGMVAGLPVIASDIPAMHEVVTGAGGIVVRPKDIEGLAAALSSYLSISDQDRDAIGARAYKYIQSNHLIDNYRASYLSLVSSSLGDASLNKEAVGGNPNG